MTDGAAGMICVLLCSSVANFRVWFRGGEEVGHQMGQPIKTITIEGFKSIRRLEAFGLGPLNVLIGANGAGKSNFVDFFRLVRAVASHGLQRFVNVNGGADRLLHFGPKVTPRLRAAIGSAGESGYEFELEPTATNELVFAKEITWHSDGGEGPTSSGHRESKCLLVPEGLRPVLAIQSRDDFDIGVLNLSVYHFHDTSLLAPMRREQSARDYDRLRPDASNIAAFLLRLRTADASAYGLIRDMVRLVLPAFDDFRLRVEDRAGNGDERVRLEWGQKGSDYTFQPFQLSDGTIRFICLATALLQPDPPATVVFDEPELGLHPHALELLAALLQKAAHRTQVIVATQSSVLVSEFEPEDVVVVSREGEASTFRRLAREELAAFLADYSLGELWQKNYIDGASNG